MKRLGKISLFAFTAAVLCGGLIRPAAAISRDEVMVRAKAYAFHPWTCTTANLTASCDGGYQSVHVPGDYMGLPYDWGGYMTLFQFDQQMDQGYGAGSYPSDGILTCTSGVDCSGFVSKCWDAGHNTTSSMDTISSQISQASLLPGDALNTPGYHVVLFSHLLGTGEPVYYEAMGYNTIINVFGGWSSLSGFDPIRYDGITGTTVSNPVGTPENPIVIGSFPYSDSRDTSQAVSDVLDGCGLVPSTSEGGPEYIYAVTFTQPGQLTVAVSDDVNVDIDVHLYTSMNTSDCVARHDSSFTYAVDCGTYYVVADTYASAANAGPYQLTVDFTPSGGSCGAGPPTYDFEGELGDPCGYSGNPNLPFCNPNLGSEICLSSSSSSFCSKACQSFADCGAFPGGCCEDIGSNEFYCLQSPFCTNPTDPDAGVPDGGAATDGGTLTDGGLVGPDGSTIWPDGGPATDGSTGADAGTQTPGDDPGCNCRTPSAGGGPLLGLLLILLLALRRRLG
jgi:MYXO-CTERM domain-containing protein